MDQLTNGILLDGRFETLSPLNHGSFGMVFKAYDLVTGEIVAIKCIAKSSSCNNSNYFTLDDESEEHAVHLRTGRHPNIVNLIHSFETKDHTFLVLEYCSNGDLYEAIRVGCGPRETEHVREFMFELVDAVEFMHSKGVYHRDIKPENIFLTHTGSMKLGDFGLATTHASTDEALVGSDRYMAPEQYDPGNSGYLPAKADIWALGICLLNILFSRNPFAKPTVSDPLFSDFAGDRQTLFDVFPTMSQDTFEVLVHSLAIDPTRRSLQTVREALDRVVSFTTDDESLDDFCPEDRKVAPASANREPLRTPSLSAVQINQGIPHPLSKPLAVTQPQPIQQFCAIPDNDYCVDNLFPSPESPNRIWYPDKSNGSPASLADSGLGVSFESSIETDLRPMMDKQSKSLTSDSIPIMSARPCSRMNSGLTKKRDYVSKSWSDLWDEEEEEKWKNGMQNMVVHRTGVKECLRNCEQNSGCTTPRPVLAEIKNLSMVSCSRNRANDYVALQNSDDVSENTGFLFEEHHFENMPKYSPPPKLYSTIDKWEALGDRRRAYGTPVKVPTLETAIPIRPRKWARRNTLKHGMFISPQQKGTCEQFRRVHGMKEQKDWNIRKGWRLHAGMDDIGDLEWVGGWD